MKIFAKRREGTPTFRFHNSSDACAWVTEYWSYFNRSTLGPQMRIRTQVNSTANGAGTSG